MNAAGTLRTTLVVLLASASIQPLAAQNSQVDGQVRNRLGYGIPGVEIHVLESGARVVTDNATFVLLPVPAALAEGEAVPPGGVVPRDTRRDGCSTSATSAAPRPPGLKPRPGRS